MITLNEDGTAKVSVRYSIRKGEPGYSSHEVSASTELDVKVDADSVPQAQEQLGELQDYLLDQLKVGVIAAIGMEPIVTDGGVTLPKFEAPPAPAPVAAPAPAGGGGGGGGGFTPPKATKEQLAQLPRYQVDFGKGMSVYIDQRPLKEPLGPYSAKAPDFKNATDKDDGVWIMGRNGEPNGQVTAAMQAAGIPHVVEALPQPPSAAPF